MPAPKTTKVSLGELKRFSKSAVEFNQDMRFITTRVEKSSLGSTAVIGYAVVMS